MLKVINGGFEPVRSTKYSAYVDLFSREDVVIGAGETKIVKLGVKIDLEELMDNYFYLNSRLLPEKNDIMYNVLRHNATDLFLSSHYLEVALRSSLAVKGLIVANGIGVIDLDYPDEIGLIVHNPVKLEDAKQFIDLENGKPLSKVRNSAFIVSKGDKVAQCTLKEHKGYLMGYESDVIREGGYGSTGN